MAIKQYLDEAMQKVIAERDREVAVIKQKATQEKIVPHNAEIDNASNLAISKLQKEFTDRTNAEQQAHNARVTAEQQAHNERISALQKEFTEKKQEIVNAGIAEKDEFARNTINTETAPAMVKYDSAIAKIREQIQSIEE